MPVALSFALGATHSQARPLKTTSAALTVRTQFLYTPYFMIGVCGTFQWCGIARIATLIVPTFRWSAFYYPTTSSSSLSCAMEIVNSCFAYACCLVQVGVGECFEFAKECGQFVKAEVVHQTERNVFSLKNGLCEDKCLSEEKRLHPTSQNHSVDVIICTSLTKIAISSA